MPTCFPARVAYTLIFSILIGTAFLLRFEMVSQTVVVSPIRADARDYFLYAYNLTHHGVYSRDAKGLSDGSQAIKPDGARNPGYPLFLSLFMGSPSLETFLSRVLFSQVIISTFTVVVAFFLYRSFLNQVGSLLAAALTALSPHLIVMNIYLLSETLFCCFLVAAGWWVSRPASRTSWIHTGVLGALLGVAYLVRPSLLIFPIAMVLFMGTVLPGSFRGRRAAALLVGVALVIAPWFARNVVAINNVSDNTLQINFLHHGIYPDFMYNGKEESFGFPYRFDPRSAQISQSTASVLRELLERFFTTPVEHAVWYFFKKPIAFWSWNIVQGQGDTFVYPVSQTPYMDNPVFVWTHRIMKTLHAPLIWLGIMGCILAWLPGVALTLGSRALSSVRFISLLLLFFTLLHMVGAPFPRYSVPLRPFIYGMAVFAGDFFLCHLRHRLRRSHPEVRA